MDIDALHGSEFGGVLQGRGGRSGGICADVLGSLYALSHLAHSLGVDFYVSSDLPPGAAGGAPQYRPNLEARTRAATITTTATEMGKL